MNTQSHMLPTPVFIKYLGMMFPTETSKRKVRYGLYKCHCGIEFKTQTPNIKSGNCKSCGCNRVLRIKEASTKHGMSNHKLYNVFSSMLQRCTNPNDNRFVDYGGRGITVCEEWINNKQSFLDWSIVNGYESGLTIDRINNDKGYEPSNCRWTTRSIQSRNTRVIQKNNTSGYRGVSFYKISKKWIASIGIDGKIIYLGSFNTAIEAAKTYDKYVLDNNLEHTINNKKG
jgi:hypothetical protein